MHSQAPQDLWLPTGWPSSVPSGWSAQCTAQTLNKVHKSYTLHIGMVCTPPISQVFPTICTKCAHCTEERPMSHHEGVQSLHISHILQIVHIPHIAHFAEGTLPNVCTLPIVNLLLPQLPVFGDLSSMRTILSRSKRVVQFILPLVALWASSNPQIHYSCWWYVSHMYILRKNKKQIYIETHSKLCARSVVELKNLSLRWAPCWSDSSQEPFRCDTGAGYDLGNPFQFRSDQGTKDECVRIDKFV